MKSRIKNEFVFLIIMLIFPVTANAQRGCCSHHGGVAGCSENGRQVCRDGTLSTSCTCTPTVAYKYGCTDSKAINYDAHAEKADNSCEYQKTIEEKSNEDSNGILPIITIGGIGAGVYYLKKKKK